MLASQLWCVAHSGTNSVHSTNWIIISPHMVVFLGVILKIKKQLLHAKMPNGGNKIQDPCFEVEVRLFHLVSPH